MVVVGERRHRRALDARAVGIADGDGHSKRRGFRRRPIELELPAERRPRCGAYDQVFDVAARDRQRHVRQFHRTRRRRCVAVGRFAGAEPVVAGGQIADVEAPELIGGKRRTGPASHPVRRPGHETDHANNGAALGVDDHPRDACAAAVAAAPSGGAV